MRLKNRLDLLLLHLGRGAFKDLQIGTSSTGRELPSLMTLLLLKALNRLLYCCSGMLSLILTYTIWVLGNGLHQAECVLLKAFKVLI